MLLTLMRGLFDAYGHVGQFLGFLPPNLQRFVTSANGTAFLIVSGLAGLFFALRADRKSAEAFDRVQSDNERLANELRALRTGAPVDEWTICFGGEVVDVRLVDRRYAVALDVGITNKSAAHVSLSAALFVQWAADTVYPGVPAVPGWHSVLGAFRVADQPQLTFPLTMARGYVQGHIAFEVPDVGMGVRLVGHAIVDAIDEAFEQERQRECYIEFQDNLTGALRKLPVAVINAPQLNDFSIVERSDLAVKGNAAIWDPRT